MILLSAIAFRLVAIPVSDDYAYRMLYEMLFEVSVFYTLVAINAVNTWSMNR